MANIKGYKIKHKAAEVITATGLGSEDFEKICNDTIENFKIYSPEEAAKLTGKICARFFYEQGKKGTPIR